MLVEYRPLTALFGGTFDPIHEGHLKPVSALAAQLGIRHITLLPNYIPPHRPQPEANPQQRLEMVTLAIENNPLFSVDDRELHRSSPSYTLDTLEEIRAEHDPLTPLAFIIGQDSLLTFHQWYHWTELLNYCHLLVCARPGYAQYPDNPELQHWLKQHQLKDPHCLQQHPAGYIYLADTPLLDISANDIRQRHHQGIPCDDLLPITVQHYIALQGLYR